MAINPPNTSIVNTAGNSQYFLRTRKKAQNSAKKEKRNAKPPHTIVRTYSLRLPSKKRNGT